jgi:hypothetical protein
MISTCVLQRIRAVSDEHQHVAECSADEQPRRAPVSLTSGTIESSATSERDPNWARRHPAHLTSARCSRRTRRLLQGTSLTPIGTQCSMRTRSGLGQRTHGYQIELLDGTNIRSREFHECLCLPRSSNEFDFQAIRNVMFDDGSEITASETMLG